MICRCFSRPTFAGPRAGLSSVSEKMTYLGRFYATFPATRSIEEDAGSLRAAALKSAVAPRLDC
jgi:hypothetical protein